ncbi:MAG: hypothetical protein FJX77_00090 [Armatimonadetes bacterium]|nr:hypothetical protein [Armatimonadota bacterium]
MNVHQTRGRQDRARDGCRDPWLSRLGKRSRCPGFRGVALVLGLLAGVSTVGAGGNRAVAAPRTLRLSADLARQAAAYRQSYAPKSVIVQLANASVNEHGLARFTGGEVRRRFQLGNRVAMRVPYRALEALASLPHVDWVSPDRQMAAAWDQDVEAVGADQVWAQTNFKGAGVTVAVLDSGINPALNDLKTGSTSRVLYFKDFVGNSTTAYDDNGHGTHVAGIIAGNGIDSGSLFPRLIWWRSRCWTVRVPATSATCSARWTGAFRTRTPTGSA